MGIVAPAMPDAKNLEDFVQGSELILAEGFTRGSKGFGIL